MLNSPMPIQLAPNQPVEGWVRLLAKDINPQVGSCVSTGTDVPLCWPGQAMVYPNAQM